MARRRRGIFYDHPSHPFSTHIQFRFTRIWPRGERQIPRHEDFMLILPDPPLWARSALTFLHNSSFEIAH